MNAPRNSKGYEPSPSEMLEDLILQVAANTLPNSRYDLKLFNVALTPLIGTKSRDTTYKKSLELIVDAPIEYTTDLSFGLAEGEIVLKSLALSTKSTIPRTVKTARDLLIILKDGNYEVHCRNSARAAVSKDFVDRFIEASKIQQIPDSVTQPGSFKLWRSRLLDNGEGWHTRELHDLNVIGGQQFIAVNERKVGSENSNIRNNGTATAFSRTGLVTEEIHIGEPNKSGIIALTTERQGLEFYNTFTMPTVTTIYTQRDVHNAENGDLLERTKRQDTHLLNPDEHCAIYLRNLVEIGLA